MKRLSHKHWTEEDRQQLRELASIHRSDRAIAKIMDRTASAVGWQRRYLRIRLTGESYQKISAARRLSRIEQKLDVSREAHSAVDRLMELAEGRARMSA